MDVPTGCRATGHKSTGEGHLNLRWTRKVTEHSDKVVSGLPAQEAGTAKYAARSLPGELARTHRNIFLTRGMAPAVAAISDDVSLRRRQSDTDSCRQPKNSIRLRFSNGSPPEDFCGRRHNGRTAKQLGVNAAFTFKLAIIRGGIPTGKTICVVVVDSRQAGKQPKGSFQNGCVVPTWYFPHALPGSRGI